MRNGISNRRITVLARDAGGYTFRCMPTGKQGIVECPAPEQRGEGGASAAIMVRRGLSEEVPLELSAKCGEAGSHTRTRVKALQEQQD